MMVTEKGTLPYGVIWGGAMHRAFEVRPRLVRDGIMAAEKIPDGASNVHFGIALLAEQIISIGDIPRDSITADFLLDLFESDGTALQEAAARVEERQKSFFETNEGVETAGADAG